MTDKYVNLSVRGALAPGLVVYDVVAQKVGTVDSVDLPIGWFTVRAADFPHPALYLPISLITNIDPRDLFVSLPVLELFYDYSTPPEGTISPADQPAVPHAPPPLPRSTSEGKALPKGAAGTARNRPIVERTSTTVSVTENIAETIRPGLHIYDVRSVVVGTVIEVSLSTGWFTARSKPRPEKILYIPFSVITNIDPLDLFVSRSRDELLASYTAPPPRSTTWSRRDGSETATTTEPSGYDGESLVVEQADTDELGLQIYPGQRVYTSDTADLGAIKRYDPATGWLLIEKGSLSDKRTTVVPIALVDYVDPITNRVYLTVTRSDLQRLQHLEPVETILGEAHGLESG